MTKRAFFVLFFAILNFHAAAQESSFETDSEDVTEIQTLRVFGGVKENLNQSSSPVRVTKESLETFQYTDVNRALKQAPGVYVREEDGLGLRPNIGLRGTHPDRSKKIVLMEDGVLSGPAPYSAPAAYYTPSLLRTDSLEVFKGFSAVTMGPNSIGGAVNYLSKSLREKSGQGVDLQYGSFNTLKARAESHTVKPWGGLLLQGARVQTDGFKKLDGGGDTGYFQNDLLLKSLYRLPSRDGLMNDLELKLTFANENSHETYLGLTSEDFDQQFDRRYRASQLDDMKWDHWSYSLRHRTQLSANTTFDTVAYRHDFTRTWYRLERFVDGTRLRDVVLNPTLGDNPFYLDILQGDMNSTDFSGGGNLEIFRNHRKFFSQGVQTQFANESTLGTHRNVLEIGARLHQDQIRRNHTSDTYEMLDGQMTRTTDPTQIEDLNQERTTAGLINFKNDLNLNKWTLTAAGRYEHAEFTYKNLQTGEKITRSEEAFVPGASVGYLLSPTLSTRLSANRAVTLAGLDRRGAEEQEKAWIYEWGWVYYLEDEAPQFEIVAFLSDYQNITGTCTSSTGCDPNQLDQQFSGGQASVKGLEARYAQIFHWGKLGFPVQFNATFFEAQFDNDFETRNVEWGSDSATLVPIRKGDPLPYVPDSQYNLILGLQRHRFSTEASIIYQGRMYDQSYPVNRREIPAYGIIDWRARYQVSKNLTFSLSADNILGRKYLSSLRPFGYRPGKPQSFFAGIKYDF